MEREEYSLFPELHELEAADIEIVDMVDIETDIEIVESSDADDEAMAGQSPMSATWQNLNSAEEEDRRSPGPRIDLEIIDGTNIIVG